MTGNGKWKGIERWLAAFEERPTYMATKSDYYTHVRSLLLLKAAHVAPYLRSISVLSVCCFCLFSQICLVALSCLVLSFVCSHLRLTFIIQVMDIPPQYGPGQSIPVRTTCSFPLLSPLSALLLSSLFPLSFYLLCPASCFLPSLLPPSLPQHSVVYACFTLFTSYSCSGRREISKRDRRTFWMVM